MDWSDLLFISPDMQRVREMRAKIDRERGDRQWDVRALAAENAELRLRHGLLVRLLIQKRLITAEEYAALIAAAEPEPQR